MEIKWTPWRMAYIKGTKEEGCPLCRAAAEPDRPESLVVYRARFCYALLNLYPYNNGHLMIAPYAHLGDLAGLDTETAAEMMALAQRSVRALRRAMNPHGFNIGINLGKVAGAGIADHVHMHVVPRWQGDNNFMAVVSGTKMIPELLEETCALLRQAFQEEEGPPA